MVSNELTSKSETDGSSRDDESSPLLNRRSYLKVLAGATTVTVMASGGGPLNEILSSDSEQKYGYGGFPVGVAEGAQATTLQESEPNDTKSSATEVETGATVSGTLSAGEVDWYAFKTATKDDQTVVYERKSGGGVSALVFYGSNGQLRNQVYVSATDPVELTDVQVNGETFYVQIVDIEDGSGEYTLTNQTGTTTSTPTPTPSEQEPFGDHALTVPGRIPAEHFDEGGADIAYHDESDRNAGGAYRSEESVDIETTEDTSGDYNVGWIDTGEWLEYTVDVTGGRYDLELRVASPGGSGQLRVVLDGDHLGTIDVPSTGDWQAWTTVTLEGIDLTEGSQVLRLEVEEGGFNINWLEFIQTEPSTTEIPDDFGVQGYGEYGFGGVDA